ncbi:hypothetical protein GH714_009387 [Hevea brasiliensis]|uniref:Phytoene synthase n=1 Tax=Hevea brasiliensis TaxID=3981 RepID=A0A6A6ML92_HEVBR|nr:hypothetical protein GH714_009387 [Hevea brasiliensis]
MKGVSSSLRAAFSSCVQQVRNYDYHHYLCLLELPPNMRKAAFALRALNVETARAMDVASDPRIGLMRLLWWQETIDKIYSNKLVEHPTAQALSSVISENRITKGWLKRSVEARINDARRGVTDIPETLEELEKYAEDTVSTMLYMTLQAGGIGPLQLTMQHLMLVRQVAFYCYLAKDGGRSEVHVDSREDLCDAVFEMASVANAHLQKARALAGTVPAEARPVLLPAVPAQVLLDSLSRVQFDVFDPRLERGVLGIPPLWYQLKLKSSWRGEY